MKKFQTISPDLAKLTPSLVNSKIQTENNALYQVIQGLINGAQYVLEQLDTKIGKKDLFPTTQLDGIIPLSKGGTQNGIYIPSITLENNLDGVGIDELYWTRIGNLVTVFGVLYVTPTASGLVTSFGLELPILSYFTFISQLAGTGIGNQLPETVSIFADIVNYRAQFVWVTSVTAVQFQLPFSFSYIIKQKP